MVSARKSTWREWPANVVADDHGQGEPRLEDTNGKPSGEPEERAMGHDLDSQQGQHIRATMKGAWRNDPVHDEHRRRSTQMRAVDIVQKAHAKRNTNERSGMGVARTGYGPRLGIEFGLGTRQRHANLWPLGATSSTSRCDPMIYLKHDSEK